MTAPLFQFDGAWRIEHVRANDIAERFSTPLFVYSRSLIEQQFGDLRRALPPVVKIYYSIKANPNPGIVSVLAGLADGLEVASAGEYHIAASTGIDSNDILFAGPGKTEDELRFVLERGIGELHVESLDEVELLESLGHPVPVAIRFNPTATAGGGAMRMGGKPSQFGIDEESLPDVVERLRNSPVLSLSGVHMFAGTQLLDAKTVATQWRHAIDVARDVTVVAGRPLRTLDFGGGLGIPYFKGESELDLGTLATEVASLFDGICGDPAFSGTRFIVEPGRFLTGPAGAYVARVTSVKLSRGTTFVVLDGGMHHHLAASGNLGQVIKKDYPILNLSRPPDDPADECVVVGPLCTPLDTLGRKVVIPRPRVGDLVAVLQSGAYGLSASPVGFLSHRLPAEVLVHEADAEPIRLRADFEDPLTTGP